MGKFLKMKAQIIKDDDRVQKRLERSLNEDESGAVYIGILQEKDEGDLAIIATVQEFGDSIQGTAFGDIVIPARPFIRSTIDEENTRIGQLAERLWKKVLDGEITKREALSRIGIFMQGKIKRKIQTLSEPPNSPVTIALKGSDNPLIDKGILVNAINWIIRKK